MQLSLVDVGVGFAASAIGHYMPSFGKPHAVAAALVAWNPNTELRARSVPEEFGNLLSWALDSNPLYQRYRCVVEREDSGGQFLPPSVVDRFLSNARERGPIPLYTAEKNTTARTHLATIIPLPPITAPKRQHAPLTYTVGTLEERHGGAMVEAQVQPSGAPVPAAASAAAAAVEEPELSMEECVFPFLFPFGMGAFGTTGWTLAKYARYRARLLLTPWTLTKPYLPILHAHSLSLRMQEPGLKAVLERSIQQHLQDSPGASDAEVIRHVLKHSLPPTMPGTPAWHRRHLQDLQCMVDRWGMPSFFLTLTADELSDTRWPEVQSLDENLQNSVYGLSWRDAPAEAAYLFHKRCQAFMAHIIRGGKGAGQRAGPLGRVQHWVVRYEAQDRGSLHAHIILWVHPDDKARVASEIVACVPAVYRGDSSDPTCPTSAEYWEVPTEPNAAALFTHVLTKQMHVCRPNGCCAAGPCKYGFPTRPQTAAAPALDPATLRYQYYRPSWAHRNVSPYHPTVALLWGAHINLQVINSSNWSFYLLKYAMKCEPVAAFSWTRPQACS